MSTARDRILARVRSGLGTRAGEVPDRPVRSPAPLARPVHDRVTDFRQRAESLQSTVDHVDEMDAVPLAVARYLAGLPPVTNGMVVWPELAALDWAGAGLAVEARSALSADQVGITGVCCAIAETGTLLLDSGPGHSATASLLPETHIAVVPVAVILERMEEAFAQVLARRGELPRAVNFISGPSRTADIEQTIVIGAHGPRRVHIVLVG